MTATANVTRGERNRLKSRSRLSFFTSLKSVNAGKESRFKVNLIDLLKKHVEVVIIRVLDHADATLAELKFEKAAKRFDARTPARRHAISPHPGNPSRPIAGTSVGIVTRIEKMSRNPGHGKHGTTNNC